VEALRLAAVRRLSHLKMARGWTTWLTKYEDKIRLRRLLLASFGRLRRPRLSASLTHWWQDWEIQRRSTLGEQLLRARVETKKLKLERVAIDEERDGLLAKNRQLTEESRALLSEMTETRAKEAKAVSDAEDRYVQLARAAREEAQAAAEVQQAAAEKRLQELLVEQRRTFEDDQQHMRGSLKERLAVEERLHLRVAELEALLKRCEQELEDARQKPPPKVEPVKTLPPTTNMAASEPAYYDAGSGVLLGFNMDESSNLSVAEQIRSGLRENAARLIDLFREWDDDNSGLISRQEFHRAMEELKFNAPSHEIDTVFNSFDPDDSGTITTSELRRMLRPAVAKKVQVKNQQVKKAGAAARISVKR